ncbi:MAG: hypothetical protein K8R86_11720 [Bacteroidales bacterium]|nr:hypothetical protein [Bacteroidales bacterium]
MKEEKQVSNISNSDDEIKYYIKRKKDENSALKKLLTALENAKKSATAKNSA